MTLNRIKFLVQHLKANLRSVENSRYRFFDVGFHGDKYLLGLVNTLISQSSQFVETGANVGSTIAYTARTYPHVKCLSCEPDEEAFAAAVENTKALRNVTIYNSTSQIFLKELSAQPEPFFEQVTLFWLDAHGYGFEWPLKEELAFVTSAFKGGYILIDDFKVPDAEEFLYHHYQGQVCSFDYVRDVLNPEASYRLYYPDYNLRTSNHHPLIGWGLIIFGDAPALEANDIDELVIRNG